MLTNAHVYLCAIHIHARTHAHAFTYIHMHTSGMYVPAKKGLICQVVMGPCDVNCPSAISTKKSGRPLIASMMMYGNRKVAAGIQANPSGHQSANLCKCRHGKRSKYKSILVALHTHEIRRSKYYVMQRLFSTVILAGQLLTW